MPKKIEARILVLFVSNVMVWVCLLSVFFYLVAIRTLESQVDTNLKTTATVLASQWDGSLLLPLKPGMEEALLYRTFSERLKLLQRRTQVEGIYIAALDRTNIVASDPTIRIGQPLPRLDLLQSEMKKAIAGSVSSSRLVTVNDHQYKSAIAPIYSGKSVAAVLLVDRSPWYLVYLKSFRNSLVVFTIIALFCCVLSARLFSRTITTPISEMLRRVEEIGKAQYEKPLELKGTDELAVLAASIDTMRQNILLRDRQMRMMLNGIAHEIRNPLGGMELFTGILEKEHLNERQREYLKKIQMEIGNLKRLLNEFLEFAGPKKLCYERISAGDLLSEIHTLMAAELKEKQAQWKIRIQSNIEDLEADRAKLKQALLNLYRNAVQALPPNGQIVSIVRRNGTSMTMDISNSHSARLDPEVTEKLFEPFFTTKEKGIGLGLPLARKIIEAHGGQLRLAENTDSRITFSIHLPLANK
jgi:signal transduction histidine kinase